MSYEQLVVPNPNIPCEPGMCLQYVRQTFGAPIVEPTATAGWNNAQYQHTDYNFPEGVCVPLWFAIPGVPAGHVVLLMADGSIYSTSDDATVPHHHPSLNDLIWYYGPRVEPQYQLELQYLGWSEDISGVRVVQNTEITTESVAETMAKLDNDDLLNIYKVVWFGMAGADLIPNEANGNGEWPYTTLGSMTARINRDIVSPAIRSLPGVDPGQIAQLLVSQLGNDLAKSVVAEMGKKLT